MNADFQKAKSVYISAGITRDKAFKDMQQDLIRRNDGNPTYFFSYTTPGRVVNLLQCCEEDLFAVDGDMTPLGK